MIDPRNFVAFDVETSGESREYALQPWSDKGALTLAAVARFECYGLPESEIAAHNTPVLVDPDEEYATVTSVSFVDTARERLMHHTDRADLLRSIVTLLETYRGFDSKPVFVGWNVAFDMAWLIKLGYRDLVMQAQWLDVMQLAKHLYRVPESNIARNRRKSYSLKSAVAEEWPHLAGYEDDVDYEDFSEDGFRKLQKYGERDAVYTLHLAYIYFQRLRHHSPKTLRAALVEAACLPLIADHYVTGLTIDVGAARNQDALVEEEIAELGKFLRRRVSRKRSLQALRN